MNTLKTYLHFLIKSKDELWINTDFITETFSATLFRLNYSMYLSVIFKNNSQ